MVYDFEKVINRMARQLHPEKIMLGMLSHVDGMYKKYKDEKKKIGQLRYYAKCWYVRNSHLRWRNPLRFEIGAAGEQLKYGFQMGPEILIAAPIGASEVITAASGRFVKTDGSGRVEIAGSGHTELLGFLEHPAGTVSATEGADIGALNVSVDAIYRIPIGGSGTYVAAMKYDTCDLIVASNVQSADLTSSEDVLAIMDGDTTNNNWIDVRLALPKMHAQGVS